VKRVTKKIATAFLAAGICLLPVYSTAATETDECSQEVLLSYFPAVFVKETLRRFNVPEAKWDSINKDLASRDKEIIKIVEDKAANMEPNPLKDPRHRQEGVKLFRDTLYENFSEVMKANGINDENQIHEMLEDIRQQRAKRFARCMEKKGHSVAPAASQEDQDDDNDTEDEDDDDDDDKSDEEDDNEDEDEDEDGKDSRKKKDKI
jgi:ribosomal protein L12E/L44/L45/RPP1/RPP2